MMRKVEIPCDPRFKNLTGMIFSRLKVKFYLGKSSNKHMWWCECFCGNKLEINGKNLKSGNTKSCGCLQKEKTANTREDLTGLRFNRLCVIRYSGAYDPNNKRNKQHLWECICDCGNAVTVRGAGLKSNNTKSCGCLQKEKIHNRLIDLTSRRFGKITVISYENNRNNQSHWNCKCDCGKTKVIAGNSLKFGNTTSCGCYKKIARKTHGLSGKPGYKRELFKDPVKKLRHNVSVLVRISIKAKGGSKKGESVFKYLPYTIEDLKKHLESLWESWMNWDNYGGKSNDKKKTWHIDHIIAQVNFPYTSMNDSLFLKCWELSNLRPLEKIANMSKGAN